MIGHSYKRPVSKVYRPNGWDRFDRASYHETPGDGQVVYVVASWGPFRGIEWTTPDGARHHGSCGRGSLVSLHDGIDSDGYLIGDRYCRHGVRRNLACTHCETDSL